MKSSDSVFSHVGLVHVINYIYNNRASQGNGLKADTRLSITSAKYRVLHAVHTWQDTFLSKNSIL